MGNDGLALGRGFSQEMGNLMGDAHLLAHYLAGPLKGFLADGLEFFPFLFPLRNVTHDGDHQRLSLDPHYGLFCNKILSELARLAHNGFTLITDRKKIVQYGYQDRQVFSLDV